MSYIDPAFGSNDDHPPVHPILGQELIASVYTALANSPQWKNTLLVITYDENGGYFDHVPPPTSPDDTLARFGVDGFQQLGFRVPAMVIGPYVKQGYINSTVYNHASALKHLQNTFGLESLTQRVDAATDLSDCIDTERLARGEPAAPIELPLINSEDWPTGDASCTASGSFRTVDDPISAWADRNRGRFERFDMRADRDTYFLIMLPDQDFVDLTTVQAEIPTDSSMDFALLPLAEEMASKLSQFRTFYLWLRA